MNIVHTIVILICALMFSVAAGQKRPKTQDANDIMMNVAKVFDEVHDFIAVVDAEVKMERVQIPKMHAILSFKKPDKIHFSSQSFLLVPRDGMALNPALLHERYDATFIGYDSIESRVCYKLQLAAKEIKTRLRQMYIWVDPAHWTIVKTETIPYEGRTLSMNFSYQQSGKYWLPSKLIVTFGSMSEGEKSSSESAPPSGDQFDQLQRGIPRNGSVIILYSNYQVNTGIDDAIFESKNK